MKKLKGVKYIKDFVKTAPKTAGVYRMLNDKGNVLYVGKAKNLANRIKNYTDLKAVSSRIARMILQTEKMEIFQTETEAQALILEAEFIKALNPKFNILLKDDKSYPYIAFSEDKFARVQKFRGKKNSFKNMFGPFPSSYEVKETIKILQKVFGIRTCSNSYFKNRVRPCILHQIKRCSAPCCDKVSVEEYQENTQNAVEFLKGKNRSVIEDMSKKMTEESGNKNYEKAIIYRDKINILNSILKKNEISLGNIDDADVFAVYKNCVQVMFVRNAVNAGSFSFFLQNVEEQNNSEILEQFINLFYQNRDVAKNIFTNISLENDVQKVLKEMLFEKQNKVVKISIIKAGEKLKLIKMLETNAKNFYETKMLKDQKFNEILKRLSDLFEINKGIKTIDVFDNSHLFGKQKVGAMIRFDTNGFDKKSYRKFDIKTVEKGDDYEMMREVLHRRYSRAKTEDTFPDLVLIDGGMGQLMVANAVMKDLDIDDRSLPLVAIAKGEDRNAGEETLYSNRKLPIKLAKNDPLQFFLQNIRDESHRFVINTHRKKRAKDFTHSKLDDIEGIGAVKKRALLLHFGSVKNIENASIEELLKVDGIHQNLANTIYKTLK